MTEAEPIDHGPWPLRPFLLLALGAALGLVFHLLMRGAGPWAWTEDPLRFAAATFIACGGVLFAFSLERLRWWWSAVFAVTGGLVIGLVTWWNGTPQGWGADEGWQFFSALLAVAIAVPIFQSLRDAGALRLGYRAVHTHVWTNLVLWFAACAFVGATFLLALLLSALFQLIGIDFLERLVDKRWFDWMLVGGTLGAAVGLLRDRDKVLGLLQRVVTAILSVLAPALALGLVGFVAALPFTGLTRLWDQTRATTPILLACMAGAVILANATIGSGSDEEESRSRVLHWSAAALAGVMLPLAIVAALSTGKRIAQYGFTPDRLWAGVFVAIASAAAAAYLIALIGGRRRWPDAIRRANIRVGIGVCLLALFLALPILSFGAVSARDQLARLESGKVAPDRFDWGAMRFDFGPAGRRVLERLAASGAPALRPHARKALAARQRYDLIDYEIAARPRPPLKLSVDGGAAVPPGLRLALEREGACLDTACRLIFVTPQRAVLLSGCPDCAPRAQVFDLGASGAWGLRAAAPRTREGGPAVPLAQRRMEVRKVERQQVYVDGQPVGPDFD
jgi:hypothetical protein